MQRLRFLVVDDKLNWQRLLGRLLKTIDEFIDVDFAATYKEALDCIHRYKYALATIDRSLSSESEKESHDEAGLSLLREIRNSEKNRYSALLLVTGFEKNDLVRRCIVDYRVFQFIDKNQFLDGPKFLSCVKRALLEARSWHCEESREKQLKLYINFDHKGWSSSEILGARQSNRGLYSNRSRIPLDIVELSKRADRMSHLLRTQDWKEEAHNLGRQLYGELHKDSLIAADMVAALSHSDQHPLFLQFTSPPIGLGLPLELMRPEEDRSLASRFILTRNLFRQSGHLMTKKPFNRFLLELANNAEQLRVLIVGANSNGQIHIVEEEAEFLEKQVQIEASRLGLNPQIRTLTGSDATYSKVVEVLRSESFHLFHYAGHSRFDCELPEIKGLVFADGKTVRILAAHDLCALVERIPMQFAFLSCYLGLRGERDDFQRMFQELARADVPTVLGYRWTVPDNGAIDFAQAFYQFLWTTLSPGYALLEARHALGFNHDESTWAAPILLSQTDRL